MRPSPSHDAAAPMPPSSWPAFEAEARMSQPVPGSPTLDHQPESLAAGGVYTPSNLSSRTSPSQTNRPSPSQAGRMSPGPPPSGAGNPFSAATLPAAAGAAAPMLEWTARAEEKGAAPRGTGGQSGSEVLGRVFSILCRAGPPPPPRLCVTVRREVGPACADVWQMWSAIFSPLWFLDHLTGITPPSSLAHLLPWLRDRAPSHKT